MYPYSSSGNTFDKIKVNSSYWDGSSENSNKEKYPPEANTELKRFVHFIYNELSREFHNEQIVYEGIHHAGIQLERVLHHSQLGSSRNGQWSVADNPVNANGQNGNGKGAFTAAYTFKPFPQSFISMLTDVNGKALSDAERRKYQNPGY